MTAAAFNRPGQHPADRDRLGRRGAVLRDAIVVKCAAVVVEAVGMTYAQVVAAALDEAIEKESVARAMYELSPFPAMELVMLESGARDSSFVQGGGPD